MMSKHCWRKCRVRRRTPDEVSPNRIKINLRSNESRMNENRFSEMLLATGASISSHQ